MFSGDGQVFGQSKKIKGMFRKTVKDIGHLIDLSTREESNRLEEMGSQDRLEQGIFGVKNL